MNFKVLFILISSSILFLNCNSDDDDIIPEISLEEQNTQDDGSIPVFLAKYYFNETGVITEFSDDIDTDDDFTPLSDMAQELPSGVWYVKNPAVTATGSMPTDENTQKLLLHYNFDVYSSASSDGSYFANSYVNVFSTLNGAGIPSWNNRFFRFDLDEDSTLTEEYYEMEGFIEAIKLFNATDRAIEEAPVFQGVIIIPSRLNYARDSNYYSLYNHVAVVNFELYKIEND